MTNRLKIPVLLTLSALLVGAAAEAQRFQPLTRDAGEDRGVRPVIQRIQSEDGRAVGRAEPQEKTENPSTGPSTAAVTAAAPGRAVIEDAGPAATEAVAAETPATFYVPLFFHRTVGGHTLQTVLQMSNGSGKSIGYEAYFIARGRNGSTQKGKATTGSIAARDTVVNRIVPAVGQVGLLEVNGTDAMVLSATLVAGEQGSNRVKEDSLPVISAAQAFPRNTTTHVSAWSGVEAFYIVNLGGGQAQCKIDQFNAEGSKVGGTLGRAVKPMSMQVVQGAAGSPGRFEVSCNQPFYPFAYSWDPAEGNLSFHGPLAARRELYVPLVIDRAVNGTTLTSMINFGNRDSKALKIDGTFTPIRTIQKQSLASESVPARTTLFDAVQPLPGQTGLLKITANSPFIANASLAAYNGSTDAMEFDSIPIVSSATAAAAGSTAHLAAWSGVDELFIINFGTKQAQCNLRRYDDTGKPIGKMARKVKVGSMENVGKAVGRPARFEVTCNQPFYPFAYAWSAGDSDLVFYSPQRAAGAVSPPAGGGDGGGSGGGGGGGGGGTAPPTSGGCSVAGSICYKFDGLVHEPPKTAKKGDKAAVWTRTFKPPVGDYSRVLINFDIKNGGWQNPSDGFHQFFHYYKDTHKDLVGYVGAQGPGKSRVVIRHGFGMRHLDKPKITQGFRMDPGTVYHVTYHYNAASQKITMTIKRGGSTVFSASGATKGHGAAIPHREGEVWFFRFGRDGEVPTEPITRGWQYSNLVIEMVPK